MPQRIQYSMSKRLLTSLVIMFFFTVPQFAIAQKPDTLIKKLDSLHIQTDSAGKQKNNIAPEAYNEETKLTPASYFILLGSDFKQTFTKPFHMTKKDWLNTGGFVLGEVALSFADEPIQRNVFTWRGESKAVRNTSEYVTRFGASYEIYTLLTLGTTGFVFHRTKLTTTTFLATQAYLTGAAVEVAVKFLSGRQRPDFYTTAARVPDPQFHGPFKVIKDFSGNKENSSFPSGHTTVAFAAATVFAMEYKDHLLIPIISYSAATLIGLSRLTENRHWFTDIVAGAALGYLSGRQVVNNYHRYAKLKAPQQKKNSVTFNLDYNFGHVMPGLVYTFR